MSMQCEICPHKCNEAISFCWGCFKNGCIKHVTKCEKCKFHYCFKCSFKREHHDCNDDNRCICLTPCSHELCLQKTNITHQISCHYCFSDFFAGTWICVRCQK